MRITTSLHSDRGDMWYTGEKAGLKGEDVLDEFSRALYSVSLELDVDEATGKATIASVNGKQLLESGEVDLGEWRFTASGGTNGSTALHTDMDTGDVAGKLIHEGSIVHVHVTVVNVADAHGRYVGCERCAAEAKREENA